MELNLGDTKESLQHLKNNIDVGTCVMLLSKNEPGIPPPSPRAGAGGSWLGETLTARASVPGADRAGRDAWSLGLPFSQHTRVQ